MDLDEMTLDEIRLDEMGLDEVEGYLFLFNHPNFILCSESVHLWTFFINLFDDTIFSCLENIKII